MAPDGMRASEIPDAMTPGRAAHRCLHEIFEARVDATPSAPALISEGANLGYLELDRRANRLARHLRSRGAGPGALVALYLNRSHDAITAILAVLKSGAAYVPIDPVYPPERVRHILADADVRLLITESELREKAEAATGAPRLVLDAEAERAEIARQSDERLTRDETGVLPSDLCYIIYTSGTTGHPKGIMTEHRNVVAFTDSFKNVCRLGPEDRVYQGFSLGFDGSVEEMWMAFASGAALVVGPPRIASLGQDTARYMAERDVTFFSTVPTFLSMIGDDVPSLRLIVVSGEACPPELVRKWVRPGRRVLNVYGPTETTVNTTAWDCVPDVPVKIGRPLAGYDTYVLNESMESVAPGEIGELYIGGVGVARGYLNQAELTRTHFVPNPFGNGASSLLYRTGDLVREDSDGEYFFLGRRDDQVKVRGYRIELSEIESVLRDVPGIERAAVKVVEEDGLRDLAAYVVVNGGNGSTLDRDALLDRLRHRLPPYMVPSSLDTINELPTLASGKIDRKRLPETRTPLVRRRRAVTAPPRTDLEREIAALWEELFKTSPVSVEDDFFQDLGGYSLLAAQLVSQLRNRHDVEVALRDVYEHPTVAGLARCVTDRAAPDRAVAPTEATARPGSRQVLESVPRLQRLTCRVLQAICILLLYGLVAAPFAASGLVVLAAMDGRVEIATAAGVLGALLAFSYPAGLLLSVGLKWLIMGRYRTGRHPVGGFQWFRFWLVTRIQTLSGAAFLAGTPLMNLYWRLMGARVGRGTILDTPFCYAFDLVTIGADACVGAESHLLGARIEDGWLRVDSVNIGDRCFVGIHGALGLGARMEDDARLGDLSLLPDHTVIPRGEAWRGSPASPGDVPVPEVDPVRRRPVLFGALHLLSIVVLELFLLVTAVPGLLLVVSAFASGGAAWGIPSVLLAAPVNVISFCLGTAAFKTVVLHRVNPGTYRVESLLFLRKWLVDALMGVSRAYAHAVYTTIYLPPWLRLLGARIGRLAEISTVSQVTPDLIDIGDESFFADGSMVGGRRFFRGHVQVTRNRIGRRSFVGNNAILPVGRHLGERCLLGVLSTPPETSRVTPDGTEWLGSPSFTLPYRQKVEGFDVTETYAPTPRLYALRLLIDAIRIIVPSVITGLAALAFFAALNLGWNHLPLWAVGLLTPPVAAAIAFAAALCVVVMKIVVMGRFEPVIKPLWSTYVWWNEAVNGAYETVGAPALAPLVGTPFFNVYLRLMGCKIGKHSYVGTTLFSEFDLVRIGDHAALNPGVVVQNHLFEDRIMKSSFLHVGDGCSVGNLAVVLYDTEMKPGSTLGPLSLLMKGEVVAPGSRRIGIPTRQLGP